jgi:DNA (cytosine-5)-methyltransferase 1
VSRKSSSKIPIIDLFAGPGGLGEGLSAWRSPKNSRPFRIALSIEKEDNAHQTLELRAFFRQFKDRGDTLPSEYHERLAGRMDQDHLLDLFDEGEAARSEAWKAELGRTSHRTVEDKIRNALGKAEPWVLVGGPPCQAYSLIGRSRNQGNPEYVAENDGRHRLYREYLRIIADHWPTVFVMENVKGLLSATLTQKNVFEKIREDLHDPRRAMRRGRDGQTYTVIPLYGGPRRSQGDLLAAEDDFNARDFVIRAEHHGIPQTRHRVILLGIRDDFQYVRPSIKGANGKIYSVNDVISDLPRVRSGLGEHDSFGNWMTVVRSALSSPWFTDLRNSASDIAGTIREAIDHLGDGPMDRGGDVFAARTKPAELADWFVDPSLRMVLNHSTRSHMDSDLHRYIFASAFAACRLRSPGLDDFPVQLLPDHENVTDKTKKGFFSDRFRVQIGNRPATTITSHISKDGHYYIHPDVSQVRSLTVREAARLQTFPDNYFFTGPRTSQYHQVGNAVPPLLARTIASVVAAILSAS